MPSLLIRCWPHPRASAGRPLAQPTYVGDVLEVMPDGYGWSDIERGQQRGGKRGHAVVEVTGIALDLARDLLLAPGYADYTDWPFPPIDFLTYPGTGLPPIVNFRWCGFDKAALRAALPAGRMRVLFDAAFTPDGVASDPLDRLTVTWRKAAPFLVTNIGGLTVTDPVP